MISKLCPVKIEKMKLFICSLVFISMTNFPSFSQQQRIINQLTEIIKDVNIPGIQLIYIKNHKVHSYNSGVIMAGSDKPVTSNTIFEAASLSKTVFAYAVFRLYDRGIIDLDTPLLDIIGNYKRFDNLNPKYAKITA